MSHIAKAKNFKVTDLDVMDKTAESMGLQLVRGQRKYKTYSTNPCDHVLKLKGNPAAYEIGLLDDGTGKFDLGYDSFIGGNGMMAVVGNDCDKLKQNYAAQICVEQWQSEGLSVSTHQT